MNIKIVNRSNNEIPRYATEYSAGMDIRAFVNEEIVLSPGERKLVPTGLYIELPIGYEAQIRPRSGLALKKGIGIVNSPGTIDADYRGEIGIIVINYSNDKYTIKSGDRICQMVIAKHETIEWLEVSELENSTRGKGGFGHSGNN